jgi:hypothetical protein
MCGRKCVDFVRRYDPSDDDIFALWEFVNERT